MPESDDDDDEPLISRLVDLPRLTTQCFVIYIGKIGNV